MTQHCSSELAVDGELIKGAFQKGNLCYEGDLVGGKASSPFKFKLEQAKVKWRAIRRR